MNEIQTTNNNKSVMSIGFNSIESFENLQRMAKLFNTSSIVPDTFKGDKNFGNAVIAMEMAVRMNASPLMVMQNLYVVYGNPSWSSKFLIAMFNQCGRFAAIKYRETGKKGTDTQGVIAFTTELSTRELIEGTEITIGMAKKEGWYNKNGSKWQSIPDLMLRYRAAAFLIRTTAPELSMGLQTSEEVTDTIDVETVPNPSDEIAKFANTETITIDTEFVEREQTDHQETPDNDVLEYVPPAPQNDNSELGF